MRSSASGGAPECHVRKLPSNWRCQLTPSSAALIGSACRGIRRWQTATSKSVIVLNLGVVPMRIGEREKGTQHLHAAVKAFREALEEFTRQHVPLQWAMTQNNLGGALSRIGERENSTERLREAVKALRDALEEHTRQRVPLDWAMTQTTSAPRSGCLGSARAALSTCTKPSRPSATRSRSSRANACRSNGQ